MACKGSLPRLRGWPLPVERSIRLRSLFWLLAHYAVGQQAEVPNLDGRLRGVRSGASPRNPSVACSHCSVRPAKQRMLPLLMWASRKILRLRRSTGAPTLRLPTPLQASHEGACLLDK